MANGGRNLENWRDYYFHTPSVDLHPCPGSPSTDFIGTTSYRSHVRYQRYLLTRDPQPYCDDCLVPLTVRHLLVECPSLIELRAVSIISQRSLDQSAWPRAMTFLDFGEKLDFSQSLVTAADGGTQHQSRHPHSSNSAVGADLIRRKPREFDGKVSREAYKAQFDLLAKQNGWDDRQRGVQLITSLKDSALEVLSQLIPEEKGSYSHLVRALEQRYGTKYQYEVYRARFRTRMRNRGESLQAVAQKLDGTAHRAYPRALPDILFVLVRDQFVDTLDSVELKIQVKQPQPKNLAEALARALEFESYVLSSTSNSRMDGSSRFRSHRTALGESNDFSGSCWNCARVRHRAEDCSCSRTRRIPKCWSCNKPGPIKMECPEMGELNKKASARTTRDFETRGVSGN
ncbi:hypothetical protein E2C01_053466 [Portunus trituberculatus]|uniref:CCHC-type domain-containing protein n=1 Tax=Portunus trituberculatus TaxID=210409 RepID=A0A5B7GQD7_PORTR|nr:hypothetical protein [Portunus trituberculatus]